MWKKIKKIIKNLQSKIFGGFLLHTTYYLLPTNRKGQSLIEILVALGVGTLLVIAATTIILPSLRSNVQADKVQVSSALGKELLENVRVFSEADWHNIYNLATSSANKYFLLSSPSPFSAATGTEGISADGITSGLVGYWKLDESTGTVAHDFSGNGNNATMFNSPVSAAGEIGQSISFNGINQYANGSSTGFPLASSARTLSFWAKSATSTGNYQIVFNYGPITSTNGWGMGIELGTNLWYVSQIGSALHGNVAKFGQWEFITATMDGSGNYNLYQDGNFVSSSSMATNTTSNNLFTIGEHSSNYWFNGSIDDIRLYNRALSATEIKNIYNGGIYTRYFFIDDVGRDAGGSILSNGGTNDPSTKKATVVYGWSGGSTSSFSMYLTRFRNNTFDQTDWSGGPGQDGPSTSTNNMFSTSTGINYSTTTGSILMQL